MRRHLAAIMVRKTVFGFLCPKRIKRGVRPVKAGDQLVDQFSALSRAEFARLLAQSFDFFVHRQIVLGNGSVCKAVHMASSKEGMTSTSGAATDADGTLIRAMASAITWMPV